MYTYYIYYTYISFPEDSDSEDKLWKIKNISIYKYQDVPTLWNYCILHAIIVYLFLIIILQIRLGPLLFWQKSPENNLRKKFKKNLEIFGDRKFSKIKLGFPKDDVPKPVNIDQKTLQVPKIGYLLSLFRREKQTPNRGWSSDQDWCFMD